MHLCDLLTWILYIIIIIIIIYHDSNSNSLFDKYYWL